MTIDANLIEGFKIGMAVASIPCFLLGGLVGFIRGRIANDKVSQE